MKKLLIFGVLIVLISVNFFPNSIGESTFLDNSCCKEDDNSKDFYRNQYVNDYARDEVRYSINNRMYKEDTLFSKPVNLNFGEETSNSGTTDDLPNIIWSKTYEGPWTAESVHQTTDNGYILSGITGEDATLIKTDSNGTVEWIKHFGGDYGDEAYDAIECSDGGYLCTGGDGYTPYHGLTVTFLIKTDEEGNDLWHKTFKRWDRKGSSWGDCIIEVSDGYVILASLCPWGTTENSAVWLIKTDLNGNELWNRTHGGKYGDSGSCLLQAKDRGFVIVGGTSSFDINGGGDIWLLKTDSEGNELWNKSYGGYSWDNGKDVIQTDDNGFLIVGHYTPIYETWAEVGLIKTDSSGNLEWIRHYGGTSNDFGVSVAKTDDGGYAVAGIRLSGITSSQGWMIKTDGNGNKLWDEIIGGRPRGIIRSNDGNYVVAGGKSGEAWLMKLEDFENNIPAKPTYVYDKNSFQLKIASTDPDGDRIRYGISWYNNKVVDEWTGYYDSGEEGTINCFGKDKPAYVIAEDEHGGQSEWVMAKAKFPVNKLNNPIIRILHKFISLFSSLFDFLDY